MKKKLLLFMGLILCNLFNFAQMGIGTTTPTHKLTIQATDDKVMRLIGIGAYGTQSRINFGDANFVYIDEPIDDEMEIHAAKGVKVTSYLKVGNPTAPTGVNLNDVEIYHINFGFDNYWNLLSNFCGSGNWSVNSTFLSYDTAGSRNFQAIVSPYIWLPANINTTALRVELNHSSTTESGWDGTFLEWDSNNDGNFSVVSSWASNGYNGSIGGTNPVGCSSNLNQNGWDSNLGSTAITSVSNNLAGVNSAQWIQFRIVGMEDTSNGSASYNAYDFKLLNDGIDFSTPGFLAGSIYSEGHIFAQSNAQIGDVAEFFPIKGHSVAGDLIAMDKDGNVCEVSNKKNADLVVGVHSTSPSLFINSPKEGIPVALAGRVLVNVTNENGEIKVGDFLTASSINGFAMKASKPCYVIGRAMEGFSKKKGQVLCLVGSAWYNPNPKTESVSSGKSEILKGKKSIKIIDSRITKYSRIFVTMRGNAGSNKWIGNIKNGSFELFFRKKVKNDITFDYLINNANTEKEIINTVKKIIKKDIKTKKHTNDSLKENNKKDNPFIDVTVSQNPPSPPPSLDKVWTWDPKNGFVQMNCEYNKLIDAKHTVEKYKKENKIKPTSYNKKL